MSIKICDFYTKKKKRKIIIIRLKQSVVEITNQFFEFIQKFVFVTVNNTQNK